MRIHISGICGTFMGGIAQLAKQCQFEVSGSDQHCYPPMSTQLESAGIQLMQGYCAENLEPPPDCVVVGNAMSRGNPEVEAMLDRGVTYRSGPQWLAENILKDKWVIAVSGTHGKTTTSSMIAWILEATGMNPGFLIGGVPENFGVSARLTNSIFFVVEADEYDTAFFDKRSKFVHYLARTAVINNLEFDHADIFEDLKAIEMQFHHFVRTIPSNGLIVYPSNSDTIQRVLDQGCWTPTQTLGENADWAYQLDKPDGSLFTVIHKQKTVGQVSWSLIGEHNVNNAMMAIAASHHAGVHIHDAIEALAEFKNVKRRMEVRGVVNGVTVYDDFAHHPTAIETSVAGLRHHVGDESIIAVVDMRSNTMKMGCHNDTLWPALKLADYVLIHDPTNILDKSEDTTKLIVSSVAAIIDHVKQLASAQSHVLVMSNGGFDGIHQSLLEELK